MSWISVKDKDNLPDYGEEVLLGNNKLYKRYVGCRESTNEHGEHYTDASTGSGIIVTHWQPIEKLPELED